MPEILEKNGDLFNEKELDPLEKEVKEGKLPNPETLAKILPFITSKRGFNLLNHIGDTYLERGDFIEALKFFNLLNNCSPILQTLSETDKEHFFKKISFIYRKLEGASTQDIKEISSIINSISLNNKNGETCPPPSSLEAITSNIQLDGLTLLSPPFTLFDRLYIVAKGHHQDLYLITLDRKTKKILQKQLIGEKVEQGWMYPFQNTLPYKLSLQNGEIILLTEESLNEFSLDGKLLQVTDLSGRQQNVHEMDVNQMTSSNYLPAAQAEYRHTQTKEIFPWILNSNQKGWNKISYIELLERAGGIPDDQLIELMKHPSDEMQNFIKTYLTRKGQAALPFLTSLLKKKDANDDLKIQALEILGEIRDPSILSEILPLLEDKNQSVQGGALEVLTQLKATEAKPKIRLLAQDKDEDRNVRAYAMETLIEMKDSESIPLFWELTKDKDKIIQGGAWYALAILKAEGVLPPILDIVKNKNEDSLVRTIIINGLGQSEDPASGPILMDILSEKASTEIVTSSLEALGETHYEAAIPKMKEILRDKTQFEDIRESAANGLAAMGTPETFSALLDTYQAITPTTVSMDASLEESEIAAKDGKENSQLMSNIRHAISDHIKSEKLIPTLSNTLKDKNIDSNLKLAMVDALLHIGTPMALDTVIETFFIKGKEDGYFRDNLPYNITSPYYDEDIKKRRDALIPKLVNMVKDPELPEPAQEMAITILEKMHIQKPNISQALQMALTSDNAHIRANAAFALGNLRMQDSIPALVQHLPDGLMNSAVEYALYKMGTTGVKALISFQQEILNDAHTSAQQKTDARKKLLDIKDNVGEDLKQEITQIISQKKIADKSSDQVGG